jgi:hypothetical protein
MTCSTCGGLGYLHRSDTDDEGNAWEGYADCPRCTGVPPDDDLVWIVTYEMEGETKTIEINGTRNLHSWADDALLYEIPFHARLKYRRPIEDYLILAIGLLGLLIFWSTL